MGPLGPLGDPQQFADALRQFADLMSWQGGPVNWDLAKNVARQTVAAKGDPSVLDVDRRKTVEAIRTADLWLEDATTLPTGIRVAQAWSRSEWVEATLPVWSKLCDPIAARAVEAMGGMLTEDPEDLAEELPPEMRSAMSALTGGLGALGGLGQMMRQIGGMMVGGQTGAAVGALAEEVVSSTDVGLPLGPAGTAALLPAGVGAFGQGLSVDEDEVRLFLALREAAHHRLFAHVPWLRARLLGCRRGLRAGHHGRRQRAARGHAADRPGQPGGPERGAVGRRAVPAGGHRAAEGRAGPAGDRPGPGRGVGRRPWSTRRPATGCRRPAPSPRRSGGAGRAAAPPSGPSRRWSAWNCGRAGSARRRRSGAG